MPRIPNDPFHLDLPAHLLPEPPTQAHFVCKYAPELTGVVACNRCATQAEAQRALKLHVSYARQDGWRVRRLKGAPVLVFTRKDEAYVMFIDTALAAHARLN